MLYYWYRTMQQPLSTASHKNFTFSTTPKTRSVLTRVDGLKGGRTWTNTTSAFSNFDNTLSRFYYKLSILRSLHIKSLHSGILCCLT